MPETPVHAINPPGSAALPPPGSLLLTTDTNATTTTDTTTTGKVPLHHVLSSVLGLGPIPWRWLMATLALVWEQHVRIHQRRPADSLSQREAFDTSSAIGSVLTLRDQGVARVTKLAEQVDALSTKRAEAQTRLDQLTSRPISGVRGERLTPAQAEARADVLREQVTADAEGGSVCHRRVPARLRRWAPWATLLDAIVLGYFLAQVFNVDLAGIAAGEVNALGQSLIALLTTITFAVLGTLVVAIGLGFFGRELRGCKDADGHLQLPSGRAAVLPGLYIGLAILIALGSAVTMAYRIVTDSLQSGNGTTGAVILGGFFAVLVVVLNVVVFSVHFRDGSLLTEELDHLVAQLQRRHDEQQSYERQISQVQAEQAALLATADRLAQTIRARMSRPLMGADQLKLLARSYHQGCGWQANFTTDTAAPNGLLAPRVPLDLSVIDHMLGQLHHASPAGQASGKHAV